MLRRAAELDFPDVPSKSPEKLIQRQKATFSSIQILNKPICKLFNWQKHNLERNPLQP